MSNIDENFVYLRTLIQIFPPGATQYPIDLEERKDINTDQEVYREAIKKMKFSTKDNGKIDVKEIGHYSVYSNHKKQLQKFLVHEEKELGFVYDTYEQCITVLDLKGMMKWEKFPVIDSGPITNMFIDYNQDILYY